MIGLEKLEPGPEPGPSIMDKLGTVHACGSRAEGLENQLSLGLAGHLVRLNLEAPGSVKDPVSTKREENNEERYLVLISGFCMHTLRCTCMKA